ncbi:MAG TPA: PhzF family phenazine biosynthesis protein [Pyrinomonadaceae bacterium]|nr:PhzF family phenazine biosynthesis protein [Pyrinomonadaceae bacterium]
MNQQIFQVDAFTSARFGGNPAAVCPLTEWLDDETMLNIAAENNLSETAFFVKRKDDYEIRWFTPTVEINLCGHATLAASFVIFNCLNLEDEQIKFYAHRSGDLSVEKRGDVLVLDFPKYDLTDGEMPAGLTEAVGKTPKQFWETQGNMAMLLFETEDDIKNLEPDMSALSKLAFDEVIVTAKGASADFVSRLFAPRIGITEDPVTGATHCSLIPYWARRLEKEKLYARPLSKRGGELFCEFKGDRVKIGGNAALYLKGEIYI